MISGAEFSLDVSASSLPPPACVFAPSFPALLFCLDFVVTPVQPHFGCSATPRFLFSLFLVGVFFGFGLNPLPLPQRGW